MTMYDPGRADSRPIEEKALGLLYAMTDDQAKLLLEKLARMAGGGQTAGQKRAAMFVGKVME